MLSRPHPLWLLLPIFLLITGAWMTAAAPEPGSPNWSDVQESLQKGLPKTAIEQLEAIEASAREQDDTDAWVRAVAMRVTLRGRIEGTGEEERIVLFQDELEQAPEAARPIMQALLADWFWNYYQQNQWRFAQRTPVAQATDAGGEPIDLKSADDLRTWGRARIAQQSASLFEAALGDAAQLQAMPLTRFRELLQGLPDREEPTFRPTLYDFLVQEAIDYYVDANSTYSGPLERFDFGPESPAFAEPSAFLEWTLPEADLDSPLRRATELYQDWLQFHLADDADDSELDARLDVDLNRLAFAADHAVGDDEDVKESYAESLRRFVAEHVSHPASARAKHTLAQQAFDRGDYVQAHRIASAALNQFPVSYGGRQCQLLIRQIEQPELSVDTERVWNFQLDPHARPEIHFEYRNVEKIYVRLVPLDIAVLRKAGGGLNRMDRREREQLRSKSPIQNWTVELPTTDDYQERTHTSSPPEKLAKGAYALLASSDENFRGSDEFVAVTEVWVSELGMLSESRPQDGTIEGYIVRNASGQPVSGASIEVWGRQPSQQNLQTLTNVKTDKDGRFLVDFKQLSSGRQRNQHFYDIHFLATSSGDRLLSGSNFHHYARGRQSRSDTLERAFFFTDRAIYRPGQQVRFKVVCASANQAKNDYETLADRSVLVELRDTNGKVVSQSKLRTNRFGSASGSFPLPTSGLTGQMSLRVSGGPAGQTSFRVEEYKRPKFEVKFQSLDEPVRLNQTVEMPGRAVAYTGAPIDGAEVRYRVVREVQVPVWWWWRCWWMPPAPPNPQTITQGVTTTDPTGRFEVSFDAVPDPDVDRDSQSTFRYTVEADVVDNTGETRSASQTVTVGYTTMTASLSTENPDWLVADEPIDIQVQTQSLQNEGVSSPVRLEVVSLKKPERIGRQPLQQRRYPMPIEGSVGDGETSDPPVVPHDPNSWPVDEVVQSTEVTTDAAGNATWSVTLPEGHFRVRLSAVDSVGNEVNALLPLQVIDPAATDMDLAVANVVAVQSTSVQPGDTFRAIWGSGYDSARALVEVMHRGEPLQRFWTPAGQTQMEITQQVSEKLRGGFSLRVTMVKENRAYVTRQKIEVPWTNKDLQIRWERFVSKLKPGQETTWTAVISAKQGELDPELLEMVATLYDASLDVFVRHHYPGGFGLFYQDNFWSQLTFENRVARFQTWEYWNSPGLRGASLTYPHYIPELQPQAGGWGYGGGMNLRRGPAFGGVAEMSAMADGMAMPMASAPAMEKADADLAGRAMESDKDRANQSAGESGGDDSTGVDVDLSGIPPRKNLSETAFFFPSLTADENGEIRMSFTMPEALTRWRMIGFAHATDLSTGQIEGTAVTSKDLMVQPNPPRILREGDQIEFTVKVTNQSATAQQGAVALNFSNARTGDSVDEQLGIDQPKQSFSIPAGQSQTVSWRLSVPDGTEFLTYRAVGSTGRLSDGEEGYLPVLSRRILVHESIALPITGPGTETFRLEKLLNLDQQSELDHQSLTVQMTSNPAWYAVMALPYLMEYPHECSEQVFNKLYANLLARHVANSDPRIERVFRLWREKPVSAGRETLTSPLSQNEDLKSIALTETPWVMEAESETEARRNVGILFETNRVNQEVDSLQRKLSDMQLPDGTWPWFPGGRSNDFITLYLTTGYGRLRHLGVDVDVSPALKALNHLDAWATRRMNDIKPKDRENNHLSSTIAMYLYGRSFFQQDQPVAAQHQPALKYWLGQAEEYWLDLPARLPQGQAAVALHRFGRRDAAMAIVASLKERSVTDDTGMHWNDTRNGWWWYAADIESQAMMIEVFDEVASDADAVRLAQNWLLRQKETRNWETTKATADAVYAILSRGPNRLASDELVDVALGEKEVPKADVEAGTGFYQHRFENDEIRPAMGSITVRKTTPGIAWGGVHWQFFQPIEEVTPHDGTPLEIEKQLFVVRDTDTGQVIEPVGDRVLEVGDEIVSRLVVRTDRDMEFIHLSDSRGSGTEPTNVLSGYRYEDGLGVYQNTRDAAEHFFIDYLPKGTYVLESRCRIQLRGKYETGLATIESMYAPQYNSHSESHTLRVE